MATLTYRLTCRLWSTHSRCNFRLYSSANLSPARTRFAPSPTGSLHLGSLRTALYNYLWAKRTGGTFILRIEDTDRNRLSPGAEQSLFNNLEWAGLTIDEGPNEGGPHAPYRQSERLEIYQSHIQQLIDNGSAYKCFCSQERLAQLRQSSRKDGHSGTYDRKCHHLTPSEISQRTSSNDPFVVRLRSPETPPKVEDLVHGSISFHRPHTHGFDDVILMKADGFPTYHFANVVDDHLMQITHVIRGEEWLPSTPTHLAIYSAFNWSPPQFAHVPLLASPGGAKLSKRHGDTTVENYRDRGYLPESILNYLALMGWNAQISPGDSEVMSLAELSDRFDLTQITKGAAIVTPEKLTFLQKQQYLKTSETDEGMARLVAQTQRELEKTFDERFEDRYVRDVIDALKERIVDPLGVPDLGAYFFREPNYDSKVANKFQSRFEKRSEDELLDVLRTLYDGLEKLDEEHWVGTEFNVKIEEFFSKVEASNGIVMGVLRYALAGAESGAGVKQIMAIIGRTKTLNRIKNAVEHCTEHKSE